jgi:hypothetical protein
MEQQRTITEAARAIRPYLKLLLGAETVADQLDSDLAELLMRDRHGEDVQDQLTACLSQYRATYNWVAGFLQHGQPHAPIAIDSERGGYSDLPGAGEPLRADKFECLEGDYVWYRRAIGQVPPRCPTHGELKPAIGSD